MRLRKVFLARPHRYTKRFGQGILFTAFFLFLCQGIRGLVKENNSFPLTCNTAGAFSADVPLVLLILLAVGAIIFLGVQWWKKDGGLWNEWPWFLLLAGGLSNLWERMSTGCVLDYFILPFIPTFNLADVMLTVGVIWIAWNWYQNIKKNEESGTKR